MKFPEKLTRLLHEKGISQSRLARETGLKQTAISEFTLGKRRPYMDQGLKLARALGVSLDVLADDPLDAPLPPPAPPGTTEDDRFVLRLVRALGISHEEAIRRLAGEAPPTPERSPKRIGF